MFENQNMEGQGRKASEERRIELCGWPMPSQIDAKQIACIDVERKRYSITRRCCA